MAEMNYLEAEARCMLPDRFHYQVKVTGRKADFASGEDKVVVEVDGPHHEMRHNQTRDRETDEARAAEGWLTVRLIHDEPRERWREKIQLALERQHTIMPHVGAREFKRRYEKRVVRLTPGALAWLKEASKRGRWPLPELDERSNGSAVLYYRVAQ